MQEASSGGISQNMEGLWPAGLWCSGTRQGKEQRRGGRGLAVSPAGRPAGARGLQGRTEQQPPAAPSSSGGGLLQSSTGE